MRTFEELRRTYPRLNLTGYCWQGLGETDAAALDAWARRLSASVSAVGARLGGPWTVHVITTGGVLRESTYHAPGPLATVIAALLVNIERQQDIVAEGLEDHGFSPDELVLIASQSGMDVSRA